MRLSFFITLFSFIFTLSAYAQIPRKAEKKFEEATELLKTWRKGEALKVLDEAIEIHPEYHDAWFMKGDILYDQRKTQEAIRAYKNALNPSANYYKSLLYKLGRAEYGIGLYQDAKNHMQAFLDHPDGMSEKAIENANSVLASCDFALEKIANPVPFDPKNLGPNINTQSFEYLPALTADGQDLIFTRRTLKNGIEQEDFYLSKRASDTSWTQAIPLPGKINTPGNEGAQCITAAGNAIFFTGCNRQDGKGSCDIYVSIYRDLEWSDPINLGAPINTNRWESQPSISADGLSIYFASDREGGYGGKDIWESHYLGGGRWTEPKNLGETINTSGNEMSPFMHWDDQTLYFASDGWPNLGGLDLFISRKSESGTWSTPENLGYPINHYGDQSSMIVGSDGKLAVFTSDQLDGFGKTDLYSFQLPEAAHAEEIAYARGTIYDAKTKKTLGSKIEIVDLETGEVYRNIETPGDGSYFIVLPVNRNYGIAVESEGYLFHSQNFSLLDGMDSDRQYVQDIYLEPLEVDGIIRLKNVFFETNEYELLPSSFPELNKVVDLLKANPDLKILVAGHTDNRGSESLNKELSRNRAQSVRRYLIERGIDSSRIEFKGFGADQPIASNETPKGRAENRRTEIKILNINE